MTLAASPVVPGAGKGRFRLPFSLGEFVLALVVGLPILALGFAALTNSGTSGFSARMLPAALVDTGGLMLMVGLATALIGLVTAWLVTYFEFFGRGVFVWALVLPLAIPTYLSAYVWVEIMDFTGPVQTLIRAMTGARTMREYWFIDIRNTGGAAFVMSLVLYPYVYLSSRAFLLMQSGALASAARVLGASARRTFFTVTLPLARPAIGVGVILALMEVINDLGAVRYFGVNSLTAILYATWLNRSSFGGAAQLAIAIVAITGLLISLETAARKASSRLGARDSRTPPPRTPLAGRAAVGAILACALPVGLGFGVPAGELVFLAAKRIGAGLPPGFLAAFGNSLLLGLTGAALAVGFAYVTAYRMENEARPLGRGLLRFSTLGYAVPGTVLALGLIAPLGQMDAALNTLSRALFGMGPGLVLSGSFVAIAYAYLIRFLAVGHNTLEAARSRRGIHVLDAARVLGARRARLLFGIDLPTLSPAIIAAATLVFVECIKELPATLLLRPLGTETLSTLVFQQANAELFESAALPALGIIAAGIVPVMLANHLSMREAGR